MYLNDISVGLKVGVVLSIRANDGVHKKNLAEFSIVVNGLRSGVKERFVRRIEMRERKKTTSNKQTSIYTDRR